MNLFADIPDHLPEELVEVLAENKNVRIERIVSAGQVSPEGFWYDQTEHEWVLLLSGSAILEFEDHQQTMTPGDSVRIPAHRKHRIALTSTTEKTIWLAVFFS